MATGPDQAFPVPSGPARVLPPPATADPALVWDLWLDPAWLHPDLVLRWSTYALHVDRPAPDLELAPLSEALAHLPWPAPRSKPRHWARPAVAANAEAARIQCHRTGMLVLAGEAWDPPLPDRGPESQEERDAWTWDDSTMEEAHQAFGAGPPIEKPLWCAGARPAEPSAGVPWGYRLVLAWPIPTASRWRVWTSEALALSRHRWSPVRDRAVINMALRDLARQVRRKQEALALLP
ncbi:MAG: hypothetical protein OWS74_00525 [Firmicutes bacterium]|nr:hypothetical protein [Bacillota bacterium]